MTGSIRWAFAAAVFAMPLAVPCVAQDDPDTHAGAVLAQMTQAEKLLLLRGYIGPLMPKGSYPAGTALGAGYVPGVPRLGIPMLTESDASLGVANMGGMMRMNDEATALPSGLAMASTWSTELTEQAGRMIGAETRAKGFNVLLAGGVNLVREPRNGRNFEYLGEDPLLSGTLAGYSIRGIQSNGVLSTIKHFALNAQETGRSFLDVQMDEAAMRESDLLAFQIGIEIGQPASVMCSYNRVGGRYTCENGFLLNDVLRRDWGFKGWVMSDWGAVHSTSISEGLDQESGTRFKETGYLGGSLKAALVNGSVTEAQVDQSVLRILRSIYAVGLTADPRTTVAAIDFAAHRQIAQQVAEAGIVLLKNKANVLPLAASARHILLVGAHADLGVPAGGGSSQVWPVGGSPIREAIKGEPVYHVRLLMPSSPLTNLRQLLPQAEIGYDPGTDLAAVSAKAASADVVIVFAEQLTAEGRDVPDLDLPNGQNQLIAALAKANPHTVVVLETGGPVAMPWLDQVPAVLEAWYAGNNGGAAIARVLTGAVNPSGRLPLTFPRMLSQTPNPVLPGSALAARAADLGKSLYDMPSSEQKLEVEYPEGADVGYRWYERKGAKPLFAFGYGLSYTSFRYAGLSLQGGDTISAKFSVTNSGPRAGVEVAQLYVKVDGVNRLAGWSRVSLESGETRQLTIVAEPRLLANFNVRQRNWRIAGGRYRVTVSASSDTSRLSGSGLLTARRFGH
jgi:beta-glucosidase